MAIFHCPRCQQDLAQGDYAGWVKWVIGPLFGQLLRPLVCKEHGTIETEELIPGEREAVERRRMIGIAGGVIANAVILVLIFYLDFLK